MAKVVSPIIDESGAKIWKSFAPDAEELVLLTKGKRVQLIPAGERNGKPSHNIVLLDAPATPNTAISVTGATPQAGWTPEEKRAIAAKVEQHSDLMRFCLQTAQRKFGDLVTPEDIRPLATTLYLSALR